LKFFEDESWDHNDAFEKIGFDEVSDASVDDHAVSSRRRLSGLFCFAKRT